jgi:predicted RNA-binding protein with PUA-like domain
LFFAHLGIVNDMATWLLKTEPSEYSFDDLVKQREALWDGIANPAALANLRSARKGEQVLIYHTGDEKAVIGLAELASDPFEDPSSPGLTPEGLPKTPVVTVKPIKWAKTPLKLSTMKSDKRFADWALIKQPRLSVVPVPDKLAEAVRTLAGL